MSVRFDWQAGNDDGEWESIAHTGPRRLPRWARRTLVLLALLLFGGTAVGYGVLRLSYERARRRAQVEVLDVMTLEARLFAAGDAFRFLAQQDSAHPLWYERQTACTAPVLLPRACQDTRYPWLCPEQRRLDPRQVAASPALCAPEQPVRIQYLDLRGDTAWVQTWEGEPAVQRVRFYRRTAQGWKHTAPRLDFWQDPVLEIHGDVVVRYHERDRPYLEPVLARIDTVANDLSSTLRFASPIKRIYVDFIADFPSWTESSSGVVIALPSPWLTGLPGDEGWDPAYLEQLTYRLVYETASAAVYSSSSPRPGALQQAIAVEFTDWYTHRDLVEAPILGRIIARHGAEIVPNVFLTLRGNNNMALFIIRWLSVHPRQAAFYETCLNIERDALISGQKRSFMLFQDESWSVSQSGYFDACMGTVCLTPDPIEVRGVEFIGDYARVELDEPLVTLDGFRAQSTGPFVFYYQHEWDWKRVAAAEALMGN